MKEYLLQRIAELKKQEEEKGEYQFEKAMAKEARACRLELEKVLLLINAKPTSFES